MEKKPNKKPTGRKHSPVVNTVIAALCITIYLAAIIQAVFRFYICVEQNKLIAENEFALIAEIAYSAGAQGFIDHRFEETMKNALDSSKRIEALIILGLDRDCAVEKQKDYAVTWSNNTPKFINRFSLSSHEYYRPVPIKGLQGVSIRAVASSFDNNDVTKILKETLLIIMAGFILSFFTSLLQVLLGKKDRNPSAIRSSGASDVIYVPPSDTDEFETGADDSTPPPDDASADTQPVGLYSPRTGIGWEKYIIDRLNSELHRCSSSEQDLTLAIIEFTDLTNDKMLKQSAEEAISFFTSRDLLFEYGRWGFAALIPDTSLEASITKSKKYSRRMLDKFPGGHDNSLGIYIGLTSRSGRLLDAHRLLLEAKTALKKAKSDPKSPIIAFKSNPEKYREFISKRS